MKNVLKFLEPDAQLNPKRKIFESLQVPACNREVNDILVDNPF